MKKQYLTKKEYLKIKKEFLETGNREIIVKRLRQYLDKETAEIKIKEFLEIVERNELEFKRLGVK